MQSDPSAPASDIFELQTDLRPVTQWEFLQSQQFQKYLRKLVRLNYILRVTQVILVVGILFWISLFFAGRWAFYNPPYGHAVALYHLGFLVLVMLVFRFWAWRKLRHPYTLQTLAHYLEKKDPSLHQSLSSALEFCSPDPVLRDCLEPSKDLIQAFFDETMEVLNTTRRWPQVVPLTFYLLLLLLLGMVVFWIWLPHFVPFTGRDALILYRDNFLVNPYRPLHTLIVDPGSKLMLKGDDLAVHVQLLGPGQHKASIIYSMKGFIEQKAEMRPDENLVNSFEFRFQNLQEDLEYKIQAGPLESEIFKIEVREPAELTAIQLTYFYPTYLGGQIEVMPAGQGAARVPNGTTVEVTTRWSRVMKTVSLRFNEETPITMSQSASYWKGRFMVESGGRYILSGSSEDNVPLRGNLEFPVEIISDLPPTGEILWPREDLDFSGKEPPDKLPIHYMAKDEIGLQSVVLVAGSPGHATNTYDIITLDGKQREVDDFYEIGLKPFHSRKVFRFYLRVQDNHPGGGNWYRTPTRRLFFQPPGSFSEDEIKPEDASLMTDPFEVTAIELYQLLKEQRRQNRFQEGSKPTPEEKTKWTEDQEKLMKMAGRVVMKVYDRAAKVRSTPDLEVSEFAYKYTDSASASQQVRAASGNKTLSIRLEQVITRLVGTVSRVDEILLEKKTNATTAMDRQLRQFNAGGSDLWRRANEEGVRAEKEIALAYYEFTGKQPPVEFEKVEKEMQLEIEKRQRIPGKEDPTIRVKKEEKEFSPVVHEGEKKSVIEGVAGKDIGVTIEGSKGESAGGQAVLPTNEYIPTIYKLDPDTVYLDTPQSRLMIQSLSKNINPDEVASYRDRPVPPEYKNANEEYIRILMGGGK